MLLTRWLEGELTLDAFVRTHLGSLPLARPGAAKATATALDWDRFGTMLGAPALDALVVDAGREHATERPCDLDGLRALFARGLGLVVRRAERADAGVAAIARELSDELEGEVHVQVFASPAGRQSFGWHYDAEEVFIVQTEGEKTYYFRQNTVDPEPLRDAQPDFSRIRFERTPVMACTLIAGDFLYLPRGWWHVATAHSDSLHLSIGAFAGLRSA